MLTWCSVLLWNNNPMRSSKSKKEGSHYSRTMMFRRAYCIVHSAYGTQHTVPHTIHTSWWSNRLRVLPTWCVFKPLKLLGYVILQTDHWSVSVFMTCCGMIVIHPPGTVEKDPKDMKQRRIDCEIALPTSSEDHRRSSQTSSWTAAYQLLTTQTHTLPWMPSWKGQRYWACLRWLDVLADPLFAVGLNILFDRDDGTTWSISGRPLREGEGDSSTTSMCAKSY